MAELWATAVLLAIIVAYILWERHYRRVWEQFRARRWRHAQGRFDEGEIVTMHKGRSKVIVGYALWLTYEYEGERIGIYALPFSGEFPSEEAAEKYRSVLADREIPVRVSPWNPERSCVLDEDVKPLLSAAGLPA